MSDRAAVLFANDAFYVAFLSHDIQAMNALWAIGPTVSCVHPGWNHLAGRDVVMESWDGILANHDGPSFEVKGSSASIFEDTAVVICYEVFAEVTMVATNVFVREDGEWRIMHHQASASPPPPVSDELEQPETIQ
jgi:ketosteroid isomerase-like protein